MKKVIFIAVIIVALASWLGKGLSPSEKIWHYRMTVTVETPEGLKTGSVVREVIYRGETRGGGGPGLDVRIRGEAVTVDLGKRGVLFGVLEGEAFGPDAATDILLTAFNPGGARYLNPAGVPESGKVTLAPIDWPRFYSFKNLHDPLSAERVFDSDFVREPRGGKAGGFELKLRVHADHTEEIFGSGVRIKEVTLEMTHDPITVGVIHLLPWLPNYYDKMLDGDKTGESAVAKYRAANSLSAGAFSTEVKPNIKGFGVN